MAQLGVCSSKTRVSPVSKKSVMLPCAKSQAFSFLAAAGPTPVMAVRSFATRLKVMDALFDEEQEEVAACIEQIRFQPIFRVDRNILKPHVGRVADDGVELLADRVIEEITNFDAGRGNLGVDFNTDAIRLPFFQQLEKSTVTGRRFQRPALVAAKVEHEIDDGGRRENLAELFDIT